MRYQYHKPTSLRAEIARSTERVERQGGSVAREKLLGREALLFKEGEDAVTYLVQFERHFYSVELTRPSWSTVPSSLDLMRKLAERAVREMGTTPTIP